MKRKPSLTLETASQLIHARIHELTRTNLSDMDLDDESLQRQIKKRSTLRKALKNCTYGSPEDKAYVKDFIKDILLAEGIDSGSCGSIIPFEEAYHLTAIDKFDILMHHYKEGHGEEAIGRFLEKHGFDRLRSFPELESEMIYRVEEKDIHRIYGDEIPWLSKNQKMDILVQRIYQHYKGFGVVDDLRDMDLDGVSGGVSGDPGTGGAGSVWVFYRGKSIHLAFLGFGSEKELRRVCRNIYRYNKAGQLSEATGYKVNDMLDGSRVVVARPPFSESWAFFVRKFRIRSARLEELVEGEGSEHLVALLRFMMRGAVVTAVTGAQGTGKTTLLMALVEAIYPTLTLRVQEMSPELHLRKAYPNRNILSFKETATISGQEGLDLQKKTDGSVNILGEVATDGVASWMIEMAMVASLFTIFTHHAKTTSDLVLSLRNSLLKCDVFRDEAIAREQVESVLDFDVHLIKDADGKRYIGRVTEVKSRQDVFVWDGHSYRACGGLSGAIKARMLENMNEADRDAFLAFAGNCWKGGG